jgi:hypothetical protein
VDGYLDEARRKLRAADRFEAGRLFRAFESEVERRPHLRSVSSRVECDAP